MPVTRSGIKWTELYDNSHMYSESWVEGAQVAVRFAEVAFGQRVKFVVDMVGKSEWIPGQILRTTPEAHPSLPKLYCMEATSMEVYGNHGQNAQTKAFQGDTIRYRLTYRALNYKIREDDDVYALAFRELGRFVQRKKKWAFENQQNSKEILVFADGSTVPTVPAWPQTTIQLEHTLYRWPRAAVPNTTIEEASYHVNDAAFDVVEGGAWGAEKVGFIGVDQQDYIDAAGDEVCNLVYLFVVKVNTWNKFMKPGAGGAFASVFRTVPGGAKPFPTYDFNKLFIPA